MTSIFVTHDQEEALEVADRVVLMNAGRIEQIGTPSEVYRQPKTRFVRDFLGRVVNLRGTADAGGFRLGDGERLALGTPHALRPDAAAELSIRPEFVVIVPAGAPARPNSIEAAIEDLLFTGDRFEARMRVGDDSVLFDLPSDRAWREGERVRLHLPPEALSIWPLAPDAP